MPVEWREEQGLRFLYADYRGQTPQEDLETFAASLGMVESEPPGVRLLIHVDPNHRPESRFLSAVKRAMRETLSPRRTRVAFLGISGVGYAVVRGFNLVGVMDVQAFRTREDALAHLARG